MKSVLSVISLLICVSGEAQSILNIPSGAQLTIGAHASLVLDNLALTPSTAYTLANDNTLIKTTDIIHPSANASIKQAFHWLTTLNNFSGDITMYYKDADLNGLDKNSLALNIHDGTRWNAYTAAAVNTTLNYVSTSGLNNININELTLASANAALPVQFVSISIVCANGVSVIQWTSAQETGLSHYEIEGSPDGLAWLKIGAHAVSNAAGVQAYHLADAQASSTYYRVVAVDISGERQYSAVVHTACNLADRITTFPNPVHDQLSIFFIAANSGNCTLLLFDQQGKLVRQSDCSVLKGSNHLSFAMQGLSAGAYTLRIQQKGKVESRVIIKN